MGRVRVVIAVDATSRDLTADDRHLYDTLVGHGAEVEARLWGSPVLPGSIVVIRSTWDYVEHPGEFRAWLDDLDAVGARVHNPTSVLRWNMHKGYLVDLARRAVPVVPTRLLRRGDEPSLGALRSATGWPDPVLKPAVGGTARLAVHVGRVGDARAAEHLRSLLTREDVIVQPYLPSITVDGEISIVAIGGAVTHAVRKRPRSGDWRVQTEFGGSAELVEVSAELVELAGRALGVLDASPAYARVDVVRHDEQLRILELELVEPELFFRLAPTAAIALAQYVLAPDQ